MNNYWFAHRAYWLCTTAMLVIGAILLLITDDLQTMLWVGTHRTPTANFFFTSVTHLGEQYAYFLAGIFLWLYHRRDNLRTHITRLGNIAMLGIFVLLLSFLLKIGFGAPRPAAALQQLGLLDRIETINGISYHLGNTSFPSGHTMSAFALFGFLALAYARRPLPIVLLLIAALAVALSRIYLLQHFPTDTFAGGCIGTMLAVVWHRSFNRSHTAPDI